MKIIFYLCYNFFIDWSRTKYEKMQKFEAFEIVNFVILSFEIVNFKIVNFETVNFEKVSFEIVNYKGKRKSIN